MMDIMLPSLPHFPSGVSVSWCPGGGDFVPLVQLIFVGLLIYLAAIETWFLDFGSPLLYL